MDDLISRQAAIDALAHSNLLTAGAMLDCKRKIEKLPSAQPYTDAEIQKMQELEQAELLKAYECGRASAQPGIIRCKDCRKHNVHSGYKDDCCPLYEWRGMSYGHEHDYQYCSFAERREDEA